MELKKYVLLDNKRILDTKIYTKSFFEEINDSGVYALREFSGTQLVTPIATSDILLELAGDGDFIETNLNIALHSSGSGFKTVELFKNSYHYTISRLNGELIVVQGDLWAYLKHIIAVQDKCKITLFKRNKNSFIGYEVN